MVQFGGQFAKWVGRSCLSPLLTVVVLAGVPSLAEEGELSFQPAAPRQGDALWVRFRNPGVSGVQARWLNRSYPLYQEGDAWVGALPIRPETPAGSHPLRVRFRRAGEAGEREGRVRVAAVRFSVQHLRMAAGTARLYHYPGVEKEEREIGAAIRTRSEMRVGTGDWSAPARGRLSTPFGVQRLRNGRAVGRHRGRDIAAPEGAPVTAPAAGRVVLSASYRKHGKTVALDHGQGITSLYLHLSALHARRGQSVERGAPLGSIGSTGVATGPHLHWSVYVHGTPVEPAFFQRLAARGVTPGSPSEKR